MEVLTQFANIQNLRMLYDQEGVSALLILPSKADLDSLLQCKATVNDQPLEITADGAEEEQKNKGLKSKSNSFYPSQEGQKETPTISKFDGSQPNNLMNQQ